MAARRKTDALVVGAGPVGLYAALALRRRGADVRIVDADWRTAALSYALALHPASLGLLDSAGVLRDVLPHGYRVSHVGFYEGEERRADLDLTKLDAGHPFVLVLPQNALEGALERALADRGVPVEWNHELSALHGAGEAVEAVVEKLGKSSGGYAVSGTDWVVMRRLAIEADLLVGADGHRSTVRRQLGIDWEELGPSELYAVFEFETDWDARGEVRVFFHDGLAGVLWPLPRRRCRFSFQVTGSDAAVEGRVKSRLSLTVGKDAYPHLEAESLPELIALRAPWFTGLVREIRWSLLVKFERRLAAGWGAGNVWLAGDSAHTTGPVGAQSMNAGLLEAEEIARLFHEVRARRLVRDAYAEHGRRRQAEWRTLLAAEGVRAGPSADPFLADRLPQVLPCIPASGEHLRDLAGQVGLVFGPEA